MAHKSCLVFERSDYQLKIRKMKKIEIKSYFVCKRGKRSAWLDDHRQCEQTSFLPRQPASLPRWAS